MKTKIFVWIGLIIQFLFLLFFLFNAPETYGPIQVGLQQLKTASPAEAAKIPENSTGATPIATSGDYFQMAGIRFKSLVSATLTFAVVNVIISILLLLSLRGKQVVMQQSTT